MRATNLTIVQGTPFKFAVNVQYKDDTDTLVPLPLPGAFVHLQARPSTRSDDVILDLSSDGNGIVLDEDNGRFEIIMTDEETSALVWGIAHTAVTAPYQCEVTKDDGETIRVLKGMLTLDPEVVR